MLLYPGQEEDDAPNTERVAFIFSISAQRALIGWDAHGLRISTALF